jgi:putative nucleotidyltransferase with HDIG domain
MRRLPDRAEAELTAEMQLAELPDRWLHTQQVAARAEELATAVPAEERELVVVAAWWHDLGYSPELRTSGMHQLDGASYLAAQGYPDRLCALVAHHSAAAFEATERGLLAELDVWPREESAVADALWTADMTTGPRGERLRFPARFEEILERYRADSPVARAMRRARPSIEAAIARTEARLAGRLGPSADLGVR